MAKVISFRDRKILHQSISPESVIDGWEMVLEANNMTIEDVENFHIVSTSPELNVYITNSYYLKNISNDMLGYFYDCPEEVCDKKLWAKSLAVTWKISSVLILRHSKKFLKMMGLTLIVLGATGIALDLLLSSLP